MDVPFAIPVVAKAVQHVSADIAAASPGFVDAADLSMLAASLDNCASYCTSTGCQPDGTPAWCTWRADLNCNGSIEAADLSILARDLRPSSAWECNLTKVDPEDNDIDRILSWFGMMRTGRTIVQLGDETPEIAVVDEVQMQRAIADPYGYRTQVTPVVRLSWSNVKALYRQAATGSTLFQDTRPPLAPGNVERKDESPSWRPPGSCWGSPCFGDRHPGRDRSVRSGVL